MTVHFTFSFKIFNKTAVLICHSFREDLCGFEEYP